MAKKDFNNIQKDIDSTAGVNFNASISIVNINNIAKEMQSYLPDDYTRSQNSNVFATLYGTGEEFRSLKQRLKQAETNNYLYTVESETNYTQINGIGKYYVEFQVPFIDAPYNINIVGSSLQYTNVFVEYTSQYGMILNVLTDLKDVVTWTVSGLIGAASDEYLGDALYQNFGALYNFPRQNDAQIDESAVLPYEKTNLFITVESPIIPAIVLNELTVTNGFTSFTVAASSTVVNNFDENGNFQSVSVTDFTYNPSPENKNANAVYYPGIIYPTSVISNPQATHELRDANNNIIALLDANSQSIYANTLAPSYGNNVYKQNITAKNNSFSFNKIGNNLTSPYLVYINGYQSTYHFDRWKQPGYIQEVYRADNRYRRLLAGINRALLQGPNVQGFADLTEAMFAQPYIPYDVWQNNDFRVLKNSLNQTTPKYQVNGNYITQYDSYIANKPMVDVIRVSSTWTPDSITYDNMPDLSSNNPKAVIATIDGLPVTVQNLNQITRFDLTGEINRSLRLALEGIHTGGVINWNYAITQSNNANLLNPLSDVFNLYQNNSYCFLNDISDSYLDLNLIYYYLNYQDNRPNSYVAQTLLNGRDYLIFSVSQFLNADGSYNLPSELLQGYNVNSSQPYIGSYTDINGNIVPNVDAYGNTQWLGAEIGNQKVLPNFLIQLQLQNNPNLPNNINNIYNAYTFSSPLTAGAPPFPLDTNNFLLYSYAELNSLSASVDGNFNYDVTNPTFKKYYDASFVAAVQPSDTPFIKNTVSNSMSTNFLAQGSFGKFVAPNGYEYILNMNNGDITFNKSINISDLKQRTPVNGEKFNYITYTNGVSSINHFSSPVFYQISINNSNHVWFSENDFQNYIENGGILGTITSNNIGSLNTPYYYQYSNSEYLIEGYIYPYNPLSTFNIYQLQFQKYCIVDENNNLLALLDGSGLSYNVSNSINPSMIGQKIIVAGKVLNTFWDTRIPITNYYTGTPVVQATSDFPNEVIALTQSFGLSANNNYSVLINQIPNGSEGFITASWTFNIYGTSRTTLFSSGSLGFADVSPVTTTATISSMVFGSNIVYLNNSNSLIKIGQIVYGPGIPYNTYVTSINNNVITLTQPVIYSSINNVLTFCNEYITGIVNQFTGYTNSIVGTNGLIYELDNSESPFVPGNYVDSMYNQTYIALPFNGYFLNYLDYVNEFNSSTFQSKLKSSGDFGLIDSLEQEYNASYPNTGSILNFFNPTHGIVSYSILTDMNFINLNNSTTINIYRPNNNGIALKMHGDSYAGLVFYGKSENSLIDKPIKLSVSFTYNSTEVTLRKKTLEIEDNNYANWVDALQPNTVMSGNTFYITGNQFKYSNKGFDQFYKPGNNYDNSSRNSGYAYNATVTANNPGYANLPIADVTGKTLTANEYSINDSNPIFQVTPDIVNTLVSNGYGNPGPNMKFKNPISQPNYYNVTPEKISFLQFDLSGFPYDSIIKEGIMEIYFGSGFTIKEAKNSNLILNDNSLSINSTLSGNGKTQLVPAVDNGIYTDSVSPSASIIKPLNNVHWRKNYFEVILPYAFMSEINALDYGLQNIFGFNTSFNNIKPVNPQPNLEYLGFINLDETDINSLTINTMTTPLSSFNFVENSVGLTNILIDSNSVIYGVDGILTFSPSNSANLDGNTIINRESQIKLSHAISLDGTPQYFYYTALDSDNNVIKDTVGNPVILSYYDVFTTVGFDSQGNPNTSTIPPSGIIPTSGMTTYTGAVSAASIIATPALNSAQVANNSYGGLSAGFEADGVTPLNSNIYLYLEQISQNNLYNNQKVLIFPLGLGGTNNELANPGSVYFYGYIKSFLPSSYIGFTNPDIAMYQQIYNYVLPLYSQYTVKLLESDTYFTYKTFGRETLISNTPQDISF